MTFKDFLYGCGLIVFAVCLFTMVLSVWQEARDARAIIECSSSPAGCV